MCKIQIPIHPDIWLKYVCTETGIELKWEDNVPKVGLSIHRQTAQRQAIMKMKIDKTPGRGGFWVKTIDGYNDLCQ